MAGVSDPDPAGDTALPPRWGDRRTRRAVVAAGVGATLAAFGGVRPAVAAQADEHEVADAFGPVTAPARPQRVIAVRHHDVGNMLALGVVPVGIVPEASEFPLPEQAAALAGVANVRADTDWMLDIEKAMALAPDLILEMSGQAGDPWNEETCSQIKAAVTTLCFPYGYTYEDEIKQNMRNVGLALGLEDEAEQQIAAFDARVADLQAVVADAGAGDKPVATIVWQGSGNFFVPVDRSANMILRSLGLAQPAFQADPTTGDVQLSFENLAQLNAADTIIVMLEGAGTQEELEASPVWRLLGPVQHERVIFLDANRWGWEYLPILMAMLDDVETTLLPVLTRDSAPAASPEAAWSFTDFLGRVTTLPAPPARIAAEISTAAALYDMGVQVHSVWGYPANDPEGNAEAWGRLPVDSVVNISTVEGLPDPEKALVAETDLFLFGATELEDPTMYSEDDTPYINLPAIAPIAVWPFLDRVDKTTDALWDVAIALGADPESPENVAAQAALDATVADLQAVLAEKPGLTAMFAYPMPDELYVANPARWDDVNYFRSLGLEVLEIDPALAADWWEAVSWEQALKYQPDVIFLATESTAMSLADLREHPTFKQQPAVEADQVGVWSWYFARSPQGMTKLVQNVLDVVREAEVVG